MKDDSNQDKDNKQQAPYDKELDKITQPELPLVQPHIPVTYPLEFGFPPPKYIRLKRTTIPYGLPPVEKAPEPPKAAPPPGRKHGKKP